MKLMRCLLVVFMLVCSVPSTQAQFLFGPPQAHPFEVLGQKSGWIMLNVWSIPAFEVVDTKSGKSVSRSPVKGDHIRLLLDIDLWVAGYWKNGTPNHGDPLVSPAKVFFGAGAASHAKISAKTEVLVEDIATSESSGGSPTRILWARVSPLEEKK